MTEIIIKTPSGEFSAKRQHLVQYDYWKGMLDRGFVESDGVVNFSLPNFSSRRDYWNLLTFLECREDFLLQNNLSVEELRVLQVGLDFLTEFTFLQDHLLLALKKNQDNVNTKCMANLATFNNARNAFDDGFELFHKEFRRAIWHLFLPDEYLNEETHPFPYRSLRDEFVDRIEQFGQFYTQNCSIMSLDALREFSEPLDYLSSYLVVPSHCKKLLPELCVDVYATTCKNEIKTLTCGEQDATKKLGDLWDLQTLTELTKKFCCVVAGGAVLHALDTCSPGTGDVDVFVLHGDNPPDAYFKKVLQHFLAITDIKDFVITCSTSNVTFTNSNQQTIQFILVNYASSEELVTKFDLNYVLMYWTFRGFRVHPKALMNLHTRTTEFRFPNASFNMKQRHDKCISKGFHVLNVNQSEFLSDDTSAARTSGPVECRLEFLEKTFKPLSRRQRVVYGSGLFSGDRYTTRIYGISCRKAFNPNTAHLTITSDHKAHISSLCPNAVINFRSCGHSALDSHNMYKLCQQELSEPGFGLQYRSNCGFEHEQLPRNALDTPFFNMDVSFYSDVTCCNEKRSRQVGFDPRNRKSRLRIKRIEQSDPMLQMLERIPYALSTSFGYGGRVDPRCAHMSLRTDPDIYHNWCNLFKGIFIAEQRYWTGPNRQFEFRKPWELGLILEVASHPDLRNKIFKLYPKIGNFLDFENLNYNNHDEFRNLYANGTDIIQTRFRNTDYRGFILKDNLTSKIIAAWTEDDEDDLIFCEVYQCNADNDDGELILLANTLYDYLVAYLKT